MSNLENDCKYLLIDIEGAVFPSAAVFPAEAAGMRLDAALRLVLPEFSLRAIRRLWTWCRISVNGREQARGYIVRQGDTVRVEAIAARAPQIADSARTVRSEHPASLGEGAGSSPFDLVRLAEPFVIHSTDRFIALFKPAGLHTARIAGGREESLEAYLVRRWEILLRDFSSRSVVSPQGPPPFFPAGLSVPHPAVPQLLTRLDRATSGIVLGVFLPGPPGAQGRLDVISAFRRSEAAGEVRKVYFALIHGRLNAPLVLQGRLLTDTRKITRVLPQGDPDPVRHTFVEPLSFDGDRTLLRVTIRRGARHQIRAHLAAAGFPIVGDTVYGRRADAEPRVESLSAALHAAGCEETGAARMYLHHAAVSFPDFSARCMPEWGMGEVL